MIQALLILHGLIAAALIGAITHQAFSVQRRSPSASRTSFVARFRGVNSPTFTNAVVLMFVATFVLGGLLYPRYRIDVRPMLEDLQLRAANGIFETEGAFCRGRSGAPSGLLALSGAHPSPLEHAATRRYLTWMLAFIVWWNFLTGEVLNNIKGLFP